LYTHRRPENSYATGSGVLDATNTLLGNDLGPDADRLNLRVQWAPDINWRLATQIGYARRGAGNLDRAAWEPGTPHKMRVPSGTVVYETVVGGDVAWRLHATTELRTGAGVVHSTNGNSGQVSAEIRLDL
jgi:hypothetical protein